jgi:nitrite reductase (NADH) small subunit
VTALGRKIALSRVGDEIFALRDACPHRAGPLSCGRVSTARLELICPWHFFRFDLRTGASVTNSELIAETYPVVIENGNVYVSIQRPA